MIPNYNMKRRLRQILTHLLLTVTIIQTYGQVEPKFATAGEAEAYRAKQLFKVDYKKENHQRFKGKIIRLDKMTYKFDSVTLRAFDIPEELLGVLDNGLLFPNGPAPGLTITHIQELIELNPGPTVKRFKYLLHIKGIANPTAVFFELTNDKATSKIGTKKFIEGSTLTFHKWGWPMI
jgi:hypothetical protein